MISRIKAYTETLTDHPRRNWIIFGIAVLTGMAYFAVVMGGKVGAAGDTPTYVELSRGVLGGSGFQLGGKPSATYPPGYPIFIAPFVAVFGGAGFAVVVAQWILGGIAAVTVARIGDRVYDPAVGLVSGLGAATAPQLAMWEAYPLSDVLGLVLLLVGVLNLFAAIPASSASARGVQSSKWFLRSWVCGAAMGGSALVRPLSLSLGVPALLWAVMPWAAGSWRRRIAVLGCVFASMALVIAPWAIRNSVEFDGFFPLSTRNGWQLIQATEWTLEGRGTVGIDVTYPNEASGLSEGEADRLLTRIALERISAEPADFTMRAGTKVLFLWLPTAPGLGLASLAMGVEFCIVAVLAMGAFFSRDARRGIIFWIMSLGASIGVALTILDPDYRYRLPVLLVLMPPAAWSLVRIFHLGEAQSVAASAIETGES